MTHACANYFRICTRLPEKDSLVSKVVAAMAGHIVLEVALSSSSTQLSLGCRRADVTFKAKQQISFASVDGRLWESLQHFRAN